MTFQVRLYMHHDNDLIQLHLNGVRLCDVFAKSLEAHYKKEQILFTLPENMEFKPNKGKVYRIKVTLDEKKHGDLVKWVCAFPDQYKCHCIKNIARFYLGTAVIDALNGMTGSGAWTPDSRGRDGARAVPLKKWAKKSDKKDNGVQWIDQVSASREKTEEHIRRTEEGRKKIRSLPVEAILGRQPDSMDTETGTQDKQKTARTSKATKAFMDTAEAAQSTRHVEPSANAMPGDLATIVESDTASAQPEPSASPKADISEETYMGVPSGREDIPADTEYAADDTQDLGDFDALSAFDYLRSQ